MTLELSLSTICPQRSCFSKSLMPIVWHGTHNMRYMNWKKVGRSLVCLVHTGKRVGWNRKKGGKKKFIVLTGNQTRASRVAGENSTTEPSVLHTLIVSYIPLSCRPLRCTPTFVSLIEPRNLLPRVGSMISRTLSPNRQTGLRTQMTLEQLGTYMYIYMWIPYYVPLI